MTDAEVALELTKLVLKEDEISLKTAKDKKEFVISVYRECHAAVHDGSVRKE